MGLSWRCSEIWIRSRKVTLKQGPWFCSHLLRLVLPVTSVRTKPDPCFRQLCRSQPSSSGTSGKCHAPWCKPIASGVWREQSSCPIINVHPMLHMVCLHKIITSLSAPEVVESPSSGDLQKVPGHGPGRTAVGIPACVLGLDKMHPDVPSSLILSLILSSIGSWSSRSAQQVSETLEISGIPCSMTMGLPLHCVTNGPCSHTSPKQKDSPVVGNQPGWVETSFYCTTASTNWTIWCLWSLSVK